jgi:hypothetical protein
MRVIWFAAELAVFCSAPATAQEPCELHIFPTDHVDVLTKLWPGLVGEALAGQPQPKSILLHDIPAGLQIDAVETFASRSPQFDQWKLIPETKSVDFKVSTKQKSRLSNSKATCYAEISVASIFFTSNILAGKHIGVLIVTRQFNDPSGKLKITKMGGASKLLIYPESNSSMAEAGRQEVQAGFKMAVQQSMEKFAKPSKNR